MIPPAKNGAPAPDSSFKSRLSEVKVGRLRLPWTALLYGPEKIGKSTFGAEAPRSIFLASEEGTSNLNVARYPDPKNWNEAKMAVYDLTHEKHDFQTFVMDTTDWFEQFVNEHVCRTNNWSNIEQPDYGKGYEQTQNEWLDMLRRLEQLRTKRSMNILLLAHAHVKQFKNPTGEPYDRWELKMQKRAAALIKEWVEDILFANFEEATIKIDKKRSRGGMGEAVRSMWTQRRAPFDAGNRHGLPEKMPLSYQEYAAALDAFWSATPDVLLDNVRALLARVGQATPERKELYAKIATYVPTVKDSVEKLTDVQNRILVRLGEIERAEEAEKGQATT